MRAELLFALHSSMLIFVGGAQIATMPTDTSRFDWVGMLSSKHVSRFRMVHLVHVRRSLTRLLFQTCLLRGGSRSRTMRVTAFDAKEAASCGLNGRCHKVSSRR